MLRRIKIKLQLIREWWRERKIAAAERHLTDLLRSTPRYWRAAAIGEHVMLDLGCVTLAEAEDKVTKDGHAIAHVDVGGAFIALAPKPSDHPE